MSLQRGIPQVYKTSEAEDMLVPPARAVGRRMGTRRLLRVPSLADAAAAAAGAAAAALVPALC